MVVTTKQRLALAKIIIQGGEKRNIGDCESKNMSLYACP